MGVHDFSCYVLGVDQCLMTRELVTESEDDENEYCGSSYAIIVKIPKTEKTWEQVWSEMKLPDFAKYPCGEYEYSWDGRDFEKLEGYRELMLENCDESTIVWEHDNEPDLWLVNFAPWCYEDFVLQQNDPELLPMKYYYKVLDEFGFVDQPDDASKTDLFRSIVSTTRKHY
jgi:hypothetical protein